MVKKTFRVQVELAENVSNPDLIKHIKNAVKAWGGSFDPEDLLFPDNILSVKVSPLK